jgi:predicted MFS family arabinose efflux permease
VGLFLLPVPIGTLLLSMASSRLIRLVGAKTLLLLSTVFVTAAYPAFLLLHAHSWHMFVVTGFIGIGSGLGFPAMATLIIDSVPPSQTGVAAGMNGNARLLGQALGSGLVTSLIASAPVVSGYPARSGYLLAAAISAALMVFGLWVAWSIPGRARRQPSITGA